MNEFIKNVSKNILGAFAEKSIVAFFQFFTAVIVMRYIPREEYGVLGVVTGYFAFLQFMNISPENILVRDYKRMQKSLPRYLSIFFTINIAKIMIFFFAFLLLAIVLCRFYHYINYIYAVTSYGIVMLSEAFASVFVLTLTVQFKQHILLKIRCLRVILLLIFSLGIPYYPSIQYVAFRDVGVSIIMIFVWWFVGKYYLNFKMFFLPIRRIWKIFCYSLMSYSFWTHFIGMVTNLIYLVDTFVLSFFVPLSVIGCYNVALNLVNYFGEFFSQILNFQCGIAIARAPDSKALIIASVFSRGILLISAMVLFGSLFLAKPFLCLILNDANKAEEINRYFFPILAGLLLTRFLFSPATSLVTLKHPIKNFVLYVSIPVSILTMVVFFVGGYLWKAEGVAWANVVNGCIMAIFVYRFYRSYGYRIQYNPLLLFKDFRSLRKAWNLRSQLEP